MIRRALLLFALFLATPALVGAVDAWAFVMIGRTLLVEWDGGRMEAASVMGCGNRAVNAGAGLRAM